MSQPDMSKKKAVSAVDVVGRCKQCGSPVSEFARVVGPTGMFCSDACKDQHEAFTRRVAALDSARHKPSYITFFLFRHFFGKAVVLLILLFFIGLTATVIDIPVLSGIVARIGLFQYVGRFLTGK